MELFLLDLGRGGLSRTRRGRRLADCSASQQHRQTLGDSTDVATSRTDPAAVEVVLLADRGFADGKFMKYLRETLHWHFRIRIKRSFQFQQDGQGRKVSSVVLQPGQAYLTPGIAIGKTKPYREVYLAFAHDRQSSED